MAGFQPTEDQIQGFMAVAGTSRMDAIQRIKGNNNDIGQALNEFYDNPSSNKYTPWDETHFNKNRDGSAENHGIAFDIQAPDVPGNFGAPSRPPSRASNIKSPMGKIIDLTDEHAAGISMNPDDHDPDLARAIALSQHAENMLPQETGITSTSSVNFGPATREQYDSNEWSMVLGTKEAALDYTQDIKPADRKRRPGMPVFLKPSSQNHRLEALITIFHEIPIVRNIFLNTTDVLHSYGSNPEWWAGKTIFVEKTKDDDTITLEVDRELQRLMAFLDQTERSYGSAESLANLPEVRKSSGSNEDTAAAVLDAWRLRLENKNPGMVKQIFSVGVASEAAEQEEKKFAILELFLPSIDSTAETLYDICDDCLWVDLRPLDLASSPYLSHIAEVITFKLEGGEDHKSVKIPSVWYPDRYLKESREVALEMRLKKNDIEEKIHHIALLEDRLTTMAPRVGKTCTIREVFDTALKHDEAALEEEDMPVCEEELFKVPSRAATNLSGELRKVVASIDRKLKALDEQKKSLRSEMSLLSQLYTEQLCKPTAIGLKPYYLRGVSTTQNTMYVCRRSEESEDPITMSDDDPPNAPVDQWWRIDYSGIGTPMFTVERTTVEKTIRAANEESKTPLLVYASAKALAKPRQALPKSLEKFVRLDNNFFRTELRNTDPEAASSPYTTGHGELEPGLAYGPNSPGKRKFGDRGDSDIDPLEAGIRISERELNQSDDLSAMIEVKGLADPKDLVEGKALVGIDPGHASESGRTRNFPEMTERNNAGRTSLLNNLRSPSLSGTVDIMDLDLESDRGPTK